MLKKEFKKKDVNRVRNLVMGKTGASTGTQIGYNKEVKEYKEGDTWTENKKTWTIKNGIKQTISKLDSIKKEIFMPLSCPCCGKIMKKRLDKPNYKIHKKCYDCVINFEGKLKHTPGKYEKYIKELKLKNNLTSLDVFTASNKYDSNLFIYEILLLDFKLVLYFFKTPLPLTCNLCSNKITQS